jgi:cob(I)alamin adenosyltransferase
VKFYSGQGDDGSTHIFRSGKISKSDLIIEAVGTLDEASAFCSLAEVHLHEKGLKDLLVQIQHDLYLVMAEIAGDEKIKISMARTHWLEEEIILWGKEVELPGEFIHTWRDPASALLNVTRTVVRRAERKIVDLFEKNQINNPEILRYLNRLSSLIYVLQLKMEKDLHPVKAC